MFACAVVLATGVFCQEKPADQHHKKDCVMMKEGKMMMMKDGKTMMMDKDMTLDNGTMVMTDGTVKMKDGSTKMLENGQTVYMDGTMGMMGDKMKGKKKMKE